MTRPFCNICDDTRFVAGPKGRLSPAGLMPRCVACGALERHRAFRSAFSALKPLMSGRRALQFSDDASTMREVFADFEVSTYGGENHLDLAAIDRPDASYTMVIANHVLEHVADDGKALRELARIAGPEGVIFLSVPDLLRVEKTIEYGRAREDKHGHYRLYGPDLMERVSRHAPTLSRLGLIPTDPVTGEPDRATLLCAHAGTLARAKDLLHEAGIQSFDA